MPDSCPLVERARDVVVMAGESVSPLSWDDVDERIKKHAPPFIEHVMRLVQYPKDLHQHDQDWCRWVLLVGREKVAETYAHHLDVAGAMRQTLHEWLEI